MLLCDCGCIMVETGHIVPSIPPSHEYKCFKCDSIFNLSYQAHLRHNLRKPENKDKFYKPEDEENTEDQFYRINNLLPLNQKENKGLISKIIKKLKFWEES